MNVQVAGVVKINLSLSLPSEQALYLLLMKVQYCETIYGKKKNPFLL